MICSSCGAECTDDLAYCTACGASLKKSSVSDDTISLAPISEAVTAHARKKPVKLDIAAILAADPDFGSDPQPVVSELVQTPSEPDGPPPSPETAEPAAGSNIAAENDSDTRINPAEVLLLSLCILLGMAIAVMIILIIWPNLINMLLYHA